MLYCPVWTFILLPSQQKLLVTTASMLLSGTFALHKLMMLFLSFGKIYSFARIYSNTKTALLLVRKPTRGQMCPLLGSSEISRPAPTDIALHGMHCCPLPFCSKRIRHRCLNYRMKMSVA